MNLVVLCGNLAKDGELRTTKDGHSVFSFTIAVKRRYSKEEQIDEADFINCSSFGKVAESMAKYTKKGSKVLVQGRIQVRKYEDQMGETKYATNVMCDTCTFLTRKDEQEQSTPAPQPKKDELDDILAIGDDDLPF